MKGLVADWYPNFLTDQEFPGQARDDSKSVYFTREMRYAAKRTKP